METNSSLNIYKASAGSGKTFTLTVEYIYLMIRPQAEEEYKHTLAVTFTNKATAEMKDRILQHLYGISKGLSSSKEYLKKLEDKLKAEKCDMSVEEIRKRSGKALSMILHDYSRFRVETIDSFFQSILRTLARELGQSSNLQVDLKDNEVLEMAVDRMIDNLDVDATLRNIVIEYVTDELDENGKWNIQAAIKKFAKCIFEEDFLKRSAQEREIISDHKRVREFRKCMKDIIDGGEEELLKEAQEVLSYARSICTEELVGKRTPSPITYLQHVVNQDTSKAKTTAEGKIFTAFLEDGSAILNANSKKDDAACALFREFGDRFNAYMATAEKLNRAINSARLARNYTNQLQLLSRIDEIVRDINEEHETFPLSRTPTLLSSLIDEQDNPFIFEKIGTVLRNIMIDEFQDTSNLQWNNFKVLLFENQALGGNDLIVGDIKQSIYRWRGGEWSLLSNLGNTMSTWNPQTHPLQYNYRSEARIIDFNNRFFPTAAAKLDELYPDARFKSGGDDGIYNDVYQYKPEKKEQNVQGYTRVAVRVKGNDKNKQPKLSPEEIEEWMLADMLEQICHLYDEGLPLNKMAILLRKNKTSKKILKYFQDNAPEHIRIASDEAFLLENSSIVTILISAMRMLIEEYEEKPVAYHLFLMHYKQMVEKEAVTHDYLMRNNALELIPSFLLENRNQLKQMPLYELVEELYRSLKLERLENQEAYHYAFLDAVQLYLKDNPNDIHSFLKVWDTSLHTQAIPSGKQEGIRILTIHKSKGLEFHTVFLPYCDWAMEEDKGDTLWCEAEEGHEVYNTLGRMPIAKKASMAKSYYSGRYIEEHLQSRVDELNSLYVALTRASCNMYIWTRCTDSIPEGGITVGHLLNLCLNPKNDFTDGVFLLEDGVPVLEIKENEASDNRMQPDFKPLNTKMVSYKARLNFRQSNEAKELFGHDDSARAEGILYHNIMEEIRDASQIEFTLRKSRMQGRISQEQYDELKELLQQIDNDKLIASWFAPENRVFAECDILNPKGDKNKRDQRPDRIIMNNGVITVIDYKFGDEHKNYDGQVKHYMGLLKEIYPTHEVKGYIWYVKNKNYKNI